MHIPYMHFQNKSYYIPGDAVVYGTMNNLESDQDGESIRIFGHGTLLGDKLPHPSFAEPPVTDDQVYTYHTIDIQVKCTTFYVPETTKMKHLLANRQRILE